MVNFTYTETDNRFQFDVLVSNENGKRDQRRSHPTINSACGGTPVGAWGEALIKTLEEVEQIQVGTYPSGRILLDGKSITTNGSTVQLTLRSRSSGNDTVQQISLVWRGGNTLNGIDRTHRRITFGGTWNAGGTVPTGGTATSAPIPFDPLAGQDAFGTCRVPSGNPTVYRTGGTKTMAWTILETDQALAIDWGKPFNNGNSVQYL